MLLNLPMNEYVLVLMLMNDLMNQQVYNEYHVNINLTRLLNLEQMLMDKESLKKKKEIQIFCFIEYSKDIVSVLLFLFYQIND